MAKLQALSRAFEKAFAHTAQKETMDDLLSCLGSELSLDRIAVFEIISDGTFSNTHEWCKSGVRREKEFLQKLPVDSLDTWKERIQSSETIYVEDVESLIESDPDVYMLLKGQRIHSVVVSTLAFHGVNLGFFMLENPVGDIREDMDLVLPGLRYILSSLVYSDSLIHRLEDIGYKDHLTGAGNRAGLSQYLEGLDPQGSIGIIYCDVLRWIKDAGDADHIREEQEYIRAAGVFMNLFDEESVFRVAEHEFLIVMPGADENELNGRRYIVSNMLRDNDLLTAIGVGLGKADGKGFESVIRKARLDSMGQRNMLLESTGKELRAPKDVWSDKDRARIGIARGDEFFLKAEEFLSEMFDSPVMTAVIDINYFKLYNDIFGRKAGNLFLESIALEVSDYAGSHGGISGYMGGDNFCIILPLRENSQEAAGAIVDDMIRAFDYTDGFSIAMGIFLSERGDDSVVGMYDSALTALSEVKGSYFERYRFYDEEHFRHIRDDKIMLMDIRHALENDEFIFYIQPQVDGNTGGIIGGEALLRWNKDGNLIPPGKFIPILEKTGLIYEVDRCIWEKVVKWVRSLIDRGIEPVNCSVNVSRVDFFFTDIAEHFTKLLRKYDVPASLIGIEITESAFTDNSDAIYEAVARLHEAGFRVLMDDFGSGASSLSLLHELNFDVIKTDVNFMSSRDADSKAISIVESIVSMAHMIGMFVITEGVETELQKENLIAMGDNFVQGFYFFRPMPKENFEELISDPGKRSTIDGRMNGSSHLKFRDIVRKGMVSETLLDNILGPAAIFKQVFGEGDDDKDTFEVVQINENLSELLRIDPDDRDEVLKIPSRISAPEDRAFPDILRRTATHPLEGASGFVTYDDGEMRFQGEISLYLLYTCDDHRLYLVTARKK